jgi:hypothetical protein
VIKKLYRGTVISGYTTAAAKATRNAVCGEGKEILATG